MAEGDRRMIVHMIGNAHIDPVWLWPWQAGADEALATCRSAADRCDEYPDFIFTRGEVWVYQQVERIDPELFARIRTLIERGQWHVVGDQYTQPDTNMPTEAGWRRQFHHGRRYFRDRFGVESTVAYNVDSFGHPATLPDILASEGYVGYVFHRPNAQQVPLPATTFRWRGTGGAEVLGFRITPNYVTRSGDLYGQIMLSVDAADPNLGHTMCFYGVGNHGGGPTKANIEYIREHAHAFPGIELRFSTPQAFFEAAAAKRDQLPLVTEELQHTFPGCYSVMHDIKQQQRYGEHLLEQASRVTEQLSGDDAERQALNGRLDAVWEDLLLTEFHDILSGTSIPSAWHSVRAMQGRAWITGEEVIYDATRRWARRTLPPVNHQQVVAINPDEADWQGMIESDPFLDFDRWGDRWLADADGRPIDFQRVQPEAVAHVSRVVFPATIPARGNLLAIVRDDPPPAPLEIATDLSATPEAIANGHVRLELGPAGVRRLTHQGRDLLGDGGIGLHLREDHTDTWTFFTDRFVEPIAEFFEGEGWAVEETGPLRARVRMEGWLGRSRVEWTVTLHRDDPRVHLRLDVNFAERYRLLQLPIRLPLAPPGWTDGLAAGQVERQPSPVEWPVLGWSRVDVDGRQIALVTNDAYSLSLDGNVWQWTLLRSPKMAWLREGEPEIYGGRDWHTDQGPHTFNFILHVGDRLDPAALHTAARQQAQRPIVFDRYEGLNRPPWGDDTPAYMWTASDRRAHADGRLAGPASIEETDS